GLDGYIFFNSHVINAHGPLGLTFAVHEASELLVARMGGFDPLMRLAYGHYNLFVLERQIEFADQIGVLDPVIDFLASNRPDNTDIRTAAQYNMVIAHARLYSFAKDGGIRVMRYQLSQRGARFDLAQEQQISAGEAIGQVMPEEVVIMKGLPKDFAQNANPALVTKLASDRAAISACVFDDSEDMSLVLANIAVSDKGNIGQILTNCAQRIIGKDSVTATEAPTMKVYVIPGAPERAQESPDATVADGLPVTSAHILQVDTTALYTRAVVSVKMEVAGAAAGIIKPHFYSWQSFGVKARLDFSRRELTLSRGLPRYYAQQLQSALISLLIAMTARKRAGPVQYAGIMVPEDLEFVITQDFELIQQRLVAVNIGHAVSQDHSDKTIFLQPQLFNFSGPIVEDIVLRAMMLIAASGSESLAAEALQEYYRSHSNRLGQFLAAVTQQHISLPETMKKGLLALALADSAFIRALSISSGYPEDVIIETLVESHIGTGDFALRSDKLAFSLRKALLVLIDSHLVLKTEVIEEPRHSIRVFFQKTCLVPSPRAMIFTRTADGWTVTNRDLPVDITDPVGLDRLIELFMHMREDEYIKGPASGRDGGIRAAGRKDIEHLVAEIRSGGRAASVVMRDTGGIILGVGSVKVEYYMVAEIDPEPDFLAAGVCCYFGQGPIQVYVFGQETLDVVKDLYGLDETEAFHGLGSALIHRATYEDLVIGNEAYFAQDLPSLLTCAALERAGTGSYAIAVKFFSRLLDFYPDASGIHYCLSVLYGLLGFSEHERLSRANVGAVTDADLELMYSLAWKLGLAYEIDGKDMSLYVCAIMNDAAAYRRETERQDGGASSVPEPVINRMQVNGREVFVYANTTLTGQARKDLVAILDIFTDGWVFL
ncbi:MAG TPA: hypothetical protein PK562_04925, partial [Candidatus Omnitrophota bacterium]|nr:hypothetical protein [Candidatus Omnitrophota bacterium]